MWSDDLIEYERWLITRKDQRIREHREAVEALPPPDHPDFSARMDDCRAADLAAHMAAGALYALWEWKREQNAKEAAELDAEEERRSVEKAESALLGIDPGS